MILYSANILAALAENIFLNSTLLLTIVTAGVGSIALVIYRKQHGDEKRDAAQALYSEIVSAENKLKGIRERFFASQAPVLEVSAILEHENWSKYKYLFVKDLTREEWDTVESFYSNCNAYDDAVRLNNSYFHEDTKHIFSALFGYYERKIKEFHSNNPEIKQLPEAETNDISAFLDTYLTNLMPIQYRPQKPVNDARISLVALDTSVSLSSAGQTLRKISKLKSK
jgi:hypothetical protein